MYTYIHEGTYANICYLYICKYYVYVQITYINSFKLPLGSMEEPND